jgi:hypothetical protein
MNLRDARRRVDRVFAQYVGGGHGVTLMPPQRQAGKVYEALVLAYVVQNLFVHEQMRFQLSTGTALYLKASPGPVNPRYPHVLAFRAGQHVADIHVDVEFTTLSCRMLRNDAGRVSGDCHELDVLMVDAGTTGKPTIDQIWLGVECKHTTYRKDLLREALGIRRELGLLAPMRPTRFQWWPKAHVPADPASALLVCSTDATVSRYQDTGDAFGIDFYTVIP